MKEVIKRDGKKVKFNLKKIVSAIRRSGESTGEFGYDEALELTNNVLMKFDDKNEASVEEIQDVVEDVLSDAGYKKTAKAYILYREQHNKLRNDNAVMIDAVKSIDDYLDRSDWRVNANANQGYSLGGMILNTSGKVTANYWLSHVYPKEAGEAHRNGDIQIHDLDMLSSYTYSPDEIVTANVGDKTYVTRFVDLYNMCDTEEVLEDEENGVWCKYPKNIKVLDKGFRQVEVTRLTRKLCHRPMVKIITEDGEDLTVTDNHPVIVSEDKNNTVNAIDSLGLEQYNFHSKKWVKIVAVEEVNFDGKYIYDITTETGTLIVNRFWCHNCTGWSLRSLLQEGFNGVPGKVESNPPKHLGSALGQMVNFWGCFTGDTRIQKADGTTISFIEAVDQGIKELEVLSYNEKTGQIEPAIMNNIHKTRTVDQTIELTFEGDKKVRCTLDHKFWTWNRGWVEAQDLNEDDDVASLPERKYFTYKVTNLVNGDYYYGSHSTFDIEDGYLGSGLLIEESVKQYGPENFKKEIIAYYENNEKLKKAEIELISQHIEEPQCLNMRVTGLGRDNHNIFDIYPYANFHKILVHKGNKVAYVWRDRFDRELKDLGFEIADINLVYNNGSQNFYDPEGKANLTKGVLYKEWSLPTLGKTRPKQSEFMKKLTNSIDENGEVWKDVNGRRISEGLNRVGEDGLTPIQRKMRRVCADGLTLNKHVAKVQLERGVHPFQQSDIQRRNAAKANTPENRLKAMTTVCGKFLNWLSEKGYHMKDWDIKEVRFKYFDTDNIKVINRLPKLEKLEKDYPTIHENIVSTLAA